MITCEPDEREIPGLRYVAPFIAAVLFLLGVLLVAVLFIPGRFVPALDLRERFRHSALVRYGELRRLIVHGVIFTKIRCVLMSHAFRTSPRLAALIYHHFGKAALGAALLVVGAVVLIVL